MTLAHTGREPIRAKHLFRPVDQRAGQERRTLLSVSIHDGVVPRASRTDDVPRADDLDGYKLNENGDLILNRMRAFQGAVGVADRSGMVSPDYAVLRPSSFVVPRYLHHLSRSSWFVAQMSARLRGIGGEEQGNVRTPRINVEDLGEIRVPVPALAEQTAIADFLDAETARIDALIAKKRQLVQLVDERFQIVMFSGVTGRLEPVLTQRASCGVKWIVDLPNGWAVTRVGRHFQVQLGKMLSPDASAGAELYPYLRNQDVQWDHVHTENLPRMNFDASARARLRLKPGDLLVCEGGEVGRSAIWPGSQEDIFFQKAVHRLRPTGDANPRFLMYCLKAAAWRGLFRSEGNQSTIIHLTAEQLRAHRMPFPSPLRQDAIVASLDAESVKSSRLADRVERQIELLREHRQALITAAVTGELSIP